MSIAAVPAYLGTDFQHASPGMRFGMYLRLWGINRRSQALLWETFDIDYEVRGQNQQEREVKHENKVSALADAKRLNVNDKKTMQALFCRQQQAFDAVASADTRLRLDATATAPFTTGLGNEHPLENGFAFLNPYGLPYLPGSGVKGVLRQAARELAGGEWGETGGWRDDRPYPLLAGPDDARKPVLDKNRQPVMLSPADVLFGRETPEGDSEHVRGALTFWDVIPQIAGDSLLVEIMTPHQSHYYQQKPNPKSGDSITPHDSGQPTPISFLTVPPGSGFAFHVVCDTAHLGRLAPPLLDVGDNGLPRWKNLLTAAFEHAFEWLGFGAKTAVGYGAMITQAQREIGEKKARERAAIIQAEARKQDELRQQVAAQPWPQARVKYNRGNGALSVDKDGKTAIAITPKGQELLNTLPESIKKKVLANEYVRVTAYVADGVLVRVEAP